jgi:dTDP-4-dehydrorhamnose reductase
VRCPVAASDLAAALVELVDVDVTGVLHVAGPDALTRAELAALVTGARVRSARRRRDVPLDVRLDSAAATAALRTRVRGALALYG